MNTDEGNKLIAESEFSNVVRGSSVEERWYRKDTGQQGYYTKLAYHSSWGWLMPVVEKICRRKLGDGINTVDYAFPRTFGMLNEQNGKIMVRLNCQGLHEADTLIEATWMAVVDFITDHNKENEKKS